RPMSNIRYVVNHVTVYKRPANLTTLAHSIYTPPNSAACGVDLGVGKEYLLAGFIASGGNLSTVMCGQV
ncbi:hypothetical protein PENTCL1PPCAC_21599, partial [Pristionchus entomophagus]